MGITVTGGITFGSGFSVVSSGASSESYYYNVMLNSLPTDEWPNHLSMYANTPIDQLPIAMTDQDVDLVNDYQYRDRLRVAVRSVVNVQSNQRLQEY